MNVYIDFTVEAGEFVADRHCGRFLSKSRGGIVSLHLKNSKLFDRISQFPFSPQEAEVKGNEFRRAPRKIRLHIIISDMSLKAIKKMGFEVRAGIRKNLDDGNRKRATSGWSTLISSKKMMPHAHSTRFFGSSRWL